eukprot:Filipodium_phascolosomae@DN66_c0_g1_i1.p1
MSFSAEAYADLIEQQKLPKEYNNYIPKFIIPLAEKIASAKGSKPAVVVGVNGSQGSGKSTVSVFLKRILEKTHGLSTAVLSVDDFYLTKAERTEKSKKVHPMLLTRGPPGTHDVDLAIQVITELQKPGTKVQIPRFNKAIDDRFPEMETMDGGVQVIIFEGWFVGTPAIEGSLETPMNDLEKTDDANCAWRNHWNECLRKDYSRLWGMMNYLVFLKVPSFEVVYNWRREQEVKLSKVAAGGSGLMLDETKLNRFIQHYERLTKSGLECVPKVADVVIDLNSEHELIEMRFKGETGCVRLRD